MENGNTKKLVVLSEIDELKVIANNHYLMGKFNDAIKVTEKIIEIAERAKLYSIVREHTTFIAELYKKIKEENKFSLIRDNFNTITQKYEKLVQDDEMVEAHKLVSKFRTENENFIKFNDNDVVKEFLEKEEKQWKDFSFQQASLKNKLESLEIQLNSYLTTNNIDLAKTVLEKAKPLLKEIHDYDILKMWETAEVMVLEVKSQEDIDKKVENVFKEISILTDDYRFDLAKQKLENLLEDVKARNLTNYASAIEQKLKNIKDAQIKYKDLEKELSELEAKVAENVSQNLFKLAIDNINQIIKISRFIGKTQNLEKYTKYIEEIEQKIKRIKIKQEISENVKILNIKAVRALKKGDFINALNIFEEIISKLTETLE